MIAAVFFPTLVVGVYFTLPLMSRIINTYDRNCVFVWGDSQMYQGLDVSLLRNKLGKQILTSARPGSGIYDFLVSEKNIPNNAVSVVSFPEGTFLREPIWDNNRTGFELSCLQVLFWAGCPLEECLRIANLNRQHVLYKAFANSHILHPYSNSIAYSDRLSGFCGMFTEKKDYFCWKAEAYHQGISCLSKKHCQIVLLQFPFEQQVENCACNSINRHLSDSLKFDLIKEYGMKLDTLVLHSDSLLMHDLSHMNEVGAQMLTHQIADSLRKDRINNRFFTVVIE